MERNAATACLLVASILVLAACASNDKPPVNPNLYPTNYKGDVVATMHRILGDAVQVRSAVISDPILSPVGTDQRYTLCVRVEWQDARGVSSGAEDRIGYFYAGQLNQLIDATPEQCGKAAYKPFPEMLK